MSDNRPIGFFDSGLGGLSVLKAAMAYLPNENFIFLGDNSNAPYGNKTQEKITELAMNCAAFLVKHDAKAIVIACNTATSAAIVDIRKQFKLPVISMEPAIKPALQNAGDGRILMLATEVTCALDRYVLLQNRLDVHHKIIDVPCVGLAEQIEKGGDLNQSCNAIISRLLSPYRDQKIDGIVLGCTHYPFVQENIQRYVKENFRGDPHFYDGIMGTVRQLARVLQRENLLADDSAPGKISLHTSGCNETVLPIMREFLTRELFGNSEK